MLQRWLLCVVVGLFALACSSHAAPAAGAAGAGGIALGGTGGGHSASGSGGSTGKAGASGSGGSAGASGRGGSAGAAGKAGAAGGSGGAGSAGKAGISGSGGSAAAGGSDANLAWKQASLTNFTSYPDPGSDECVKYNGCMWAGQFAAVDGKQTEAWVMAHDIVAVHSKDFATYKLKTLRLRKDGHEIDVTVYDECADSDCSGCCTENAKPSGFLIDIEKYTAQRFGVGDGQVDWACLDCP
jgi:hypothetical protein